MELAPVAVSVEHDWIRARADVVVPLINKTRRRLGEQLDTRVSMVDEAAYRGVIDAVFTDGKVGINVATYVRILKQLNVQNDYPGSVVDKVFGHEPAAAIAGGEPLRPLAQATFHLADVAVHTDGPAERDGLDTALAAGFQTRPSGWSWREGDSPFDSRR